MADFVFDKQLIKKALISLFEKKNGLLSEDDRNELEVAIDGLNLKDSENIVNQNDETEKNDELIKLEHQEIIEEISAALRFVTVTYIDLLYDDPCPSKVKQELSYLKNYHNKIMQYFNSPFYPEIVENAYQYIFKGDMRILGDVKEYESFFLKYTQHPEILNLYNIKKRIPKQYKLEDDLFEL